MATNDMGRCAAELPSKSAHRGGRQCNHDAVAAFVCKRFRFNESQAVNEPEVAYGLCEYHAAQIGQSGGFMLHRNAEKLVRAEEVGNERDN